MLYAVANIIQNGQQQQQQQQQQQPQLCGSSSLRHDPRS
jgi:hypothetical protein